ncbi:tetratricopeptide repeat-containing diguanylate cyclase [Halioxenophilus sp. WMMB6]|uniref:tetratricopeptide repeat-containing diguanylate cyclase n=1 Tax=Halioxenophilus sp. WMMB6 TaxID=3073815 RepID=UPI00295E5517|nr:tetratricopeptide repeat-containing diguanylate cyclase [Halioxenophilus sp. WMMB6]
MNNTLITPLRPVVPAPVLLRRLLALTLCCCTLQWASAWAIEAPSNHTLVDFAPAFGNCDERLIANPNAVVSEYLALDDATLTKEQQAEKRYCLAGAYLALIYPQKSLEQSEAALALVAEQLQPQLYYAIQVVRAEALDALGESSKGMPELNKAILWAEFNQQRHLLFVSLRMRGLLKISLLDYVGALRDFNQSYQIAEELDREDYRISVASYLGLVYEYQKEYELAIPYFAQAESYYRAHDISSELSIALYGMGNANNKLGNYPQARQQLDESYQIALQIDDRQGAAYALKELAYTDLRSGDLVRAENRLKETLKIAEQSQNPYLEINGCKYLVDVYLASNRPDLAEFYADRAEAIINIDSMPWHHLALQEQRAKIAAGREDYRNAYEILLSLIALRESIQNKETAKQLLQLRSQYELDAKERRNQLLAKEKIVAETELEVEKSRNALLSLLAGMIFVVCCFLVYIVYRSRVTSQRLELLAHQDVLTGVYNRRRVLQLIENQLKLARRHDYPLAVAILDLDHFKSINDNFGHPTGDRVLEAFGILCQHSLRETDIVGRIGGEEFIVAFPHTEVEQALGVIKQLQSKAANIPAVINNSQLKVTFSCGLCNGQRENSVTDILAVADKAMYRAKEAGRDRIEVASATPAQAEPAES